MGRRIRWLGIIMVACLGLVVAQLVNIQLVKAKQLQTSPDNPRVAVLRYDNPRGMIIAADGTVLAKSVPTPAGTDTAAYGYHYVREYPQGPLYAGITGYDSALYYGTSGIEQEYDSYLGPHQQPPQTLSQLLFRQTQPLITDNVSLTVEPSLQLAAWDALTSTPGNNDGAVVVLDPKTGAVLAMVSNPTFDPNALVSPSLHAENLAYYSYTQKDHEGYYPLRPIATGEVFFPGSTMKVVTSTAAYNLKPSLAGFDYPVQQCQTFSDSNKPLCDESGPCGGTMTQMLPFSCDPGYGELGVQEGVSTLRQQAELFGFNSVPADRPAQQLTTARRRSRRFAPGEPPGQLPGVPGLYLHRAVRRAGHRAAERDGGGRDRQRRGRHDAAPDVLDPRLAGGTGRQLHAEGHGTGGVGRGGAGGDRPHGGRGRQRHGLGVGFPAYLCAAVKTGRPRPARRRGSTTTG